MKDYETSVIVCTFVTLVPALLALIARVAARRMTKMKWWWDDYFCLVAFIFCLGYNGLMIYCALEWSLGSTIPYPVGSKEYDNINLHARLCQFFISHTYTYSIGFSKLSILLFYWRIFSQSAIRIPIIILLVLSASWIILRTFMVTFHCLPVQAYWDKTIKNVTCEINDSQFFFGTCLTHFILDVFILVLPVIEVFKLRLRLGQKLAVTGLFTLGFVVCLASVFVIVESLRYNPKTTQMPRDIAQDDMWGSVEINIAIVSGCFPLLRPIFSKLLPKKFLSSYASNGQATRTTRTTRTDQSKAGICLTILNRTKKEDEDDDGSSTHQLADPEQGVFETQDSKGGPWTQIYSEGDSRSSKERDMAAVYIRSDVIQEVRDLK